MSTATLYETEAPTIEVRIYDHDHLVGREPCWSEHAVTEVVGRWSETANLFVVADLLPPYGPVSAAVAVQSHPDDAESYPLALAQLPGYGTE